MDLIFIISPFRNARMYILYFMKSFSEIEFALYLCVGYEHQTDTVKRYLQVSRQF